MEGLVGWAGVIYGGIWLAWWHGGMVLAWCWRVGVGVGVGVGSSSHLVAQSENMHQLDLAEVTPDMLGSHVLFDAQ